MIHAPARRSNQFVPSPHPCLLGPIARGRSPIIDPIGQAREVELSSSRRAKLQPHLDACTEP